MELANILSVDFIYDLARGPLVWISFIICILGTLIRTMHLLSFARLKKTDNFSNLPDLKKKKSDQTSFFDDIPRLIAKLKLTILGVSPMTITVSVVFHVCLIIIPLFLLSHNILLDQGIGISLFSFSERTTDVMTIIFLGCVLFFLLRRIFLARVRIISSLYDYLILLITTAPFLTGFFAYYQIFDYKTVIIIHMLAGELMLIAIPFTKIYHMVFFFVGRFVLVNQHTMGKGSRTW